MKYQKGKLILFNKLMISEGEFNFSPLIHKNMYLFKVIIKPEIKKDLLNDIPELKDEYEINNLMDPYAYLNRR